MLFRCLEKAKELFPGRVSIDLLFGRPGQSLNEWEKELKEVLCSWPGNKVSNVGLWCSGALLVLSSSNHHHAPTTIIIIIVHPPSLSSWCTHHHHHHCPPTIIIIIIIHLPPPSSPHHHHSSTIIIIVHLPPPSSSSCTQHHHHHHYHHNHHHHNAPHTIFTIIIIIIVINYMLQLSSSWEVILILRHDKGSREQDFWIQLGFLTYISDQSFKVLQHKVLTIWVLFLWNLRDKNYNSWLFFIHKVLVHSDSHVSLYQLTLEVGTPLYKSVKAGHLVRKPVLQYCHMIHTALLAHSHKIVSRLRIIKYHCYCNITLHWQNIMKY